MNDKEAFAATQEARREAAGPVAPSTRTRTWGALAEYLKAESLHMSHESAPRRALDGSEEGS